MRKDMFLEAIRQKQKQQKYCKGSKARIRAITRFCVNKNGKDILLIEPQYKRGGVVKMCYASSTGGLMNSRFLYDQEYRRLTVKLHL